MKVKYSSLNRLEKPKLTLCNPGSTYISTQDFDPEDTSGSYIHTVTDGWTQTNQVGILIDHEAEEVSYNFNAMSELSFRVNKVRREDSRENARSMALYKAVQNRRLIFLDDIGYFMITNVEDRFDNGLSYKDVTAQSIEVEIQQKMVPYIADGTYRFLSNDEGTQVGLLNTLVESLPLWSVGYVDESIGELYRTFENVDTDLNIYGFMMDSMQDAYECIFVFDIVNRLINVYDQNNYVVATDIHITKDDLINSLDISEDAEDIYTAITVTGNDAVTISAINPIGTNTIYNYDYYLDWMEEDLRTKVSTWQKAISDAQSDYYDVNLKYYQALAEESNYQSEYNRIDTQLTMYQRCRNNIVAESSTELVGQYNTVIINNGGTPITVLAEVAETLAEIDGYIADCQLELETVAAQIRSVQNLINGYDETDSEGETIHHDGYLEIIRRYHDTLAPENYFTNDELGDLTHFTFEGSYTDEYVTITDIMTYPEQFEQMQILYDRAKNRLERISQPTQEFQLDVENFIFVKDFEPWSEQLETGCLINVELDLNDVALLFLSNITINYDDHKLEMTFGNRFNKFDPKSLFDDFLGDVSKSANTINYLKEILYPIRSGEFNNMKEALETSRALTMGAAFSSQNEEVVIDGSGYTGRQLLDSGEYDPRQVKIIGKSIVFTDDAWDTCKVAIGELVYGEGTSTYGINAETVVGDLIVGNALRILDNDGNDLFTIIDGRVASTISEYIGSDDDVVTRLSALEQTAEGLSVRVTTIEETDPDHVVTREKRFTLNDDGLYIAQDGSEIINKIDETGMYVYRSGESVLTANNEGVDAINLHAHKFLIIGNNSRLEDYDDGSDSNRTACFYIGA